MDDFNQNHTPIDGPWVQTEQSHDEYVRRTSGKGATAGGSDAMERHRRTDKAARRRAQLRGFAPGYEQVDWREAEKEIDATATQQHWGAGDCS